MWNIWGKIQVKYRFWRLGLIPGLTVLALIIIARIAGLLQPLEWFGLDMFLSLRPPESIDSRVVIVGINEKDLSKIGSYPIPDLEIAELLTTLEKYEPRVIGLDLNRNLPIEPGYQALKEVFQSNKNIIAIEKVLPPEISPPEYLADEQLGFSDVVLDADGRLRRILLGTPTFAKGYKFSLSLRLTEIYLAAEGITLENGIIDPKTMRFGNIELPRFFSNSGGYVQADAGGIQGLINFRSGQKPFPILSLEDIKTANFPSSLVKDAIVIVGIISPAIDQLNSSAIAFSDNQGLIHGVEIHAHSCSQIISAVQDKRPLLYTLSDGWEYFGIIIGGIIGIILSRLSWSPWINLFTMTVVSIFFIVLSYLLLLLGLWTPVVPFNTIILLNGTILTAFYQYDSRLRGQIKHRQLVIDQTFDAIHNGPLQSLAQLLRNARGDNLETDELIKSLEDLNTEIRNIYESIIYNNQANKERVNIGEQEIDLETPLHEMLYQVYHNTLKRDFPNFKTLKIKIRDFEPIESPHLTLEQKRGLCRFLEESLCNVGKYAINATRLNVLYRQQDGCYILIISDNGEGISKNCEGRGTRQAKNLARQLKGKFQRLHQTNKGTICQLSWPVLRGFKKRKK